MFAHLDLALAAPALVLGLTAVCVLLLTVAPGPQRSPGSGPHLAILTLTGLAVAGLALWAGQEGSPPTSPLGLLGDGQARGLGVVALAAVGLTVPAAQAYLADRRLPTGEFFALTLLLAVGLLLVAQAADLVILFLGLEVLSLAAYALTGYRRGRGAGQEAALKYFLNGAFAAAFLLFGIALVYGDSGRPAGAPTFALAALAEHFSHHASPLGGAGAALVIAGLMFKAAAVPFHLWAPDVYEGAPTPVTALMGGAVKVAAVAALTRVVPVLTGAPGSPAAGAACELLAGLGVATVALGNLLALRQNQLKRLMAYSSVAHAGYLLLGVVAWVGRPHGNGLAWLGLYLMTYASTTVGVMGVAIAIEPADERSQPLSLANLRGLGQARPALALGMTLFMLSQAGLPPTGGFIAKMGLFLAAIDAGHAGWVALAAVASVLGAAAYLRVILALWTPLSRQRPAPLGSRWLTGSVAAALTITLGTGLWPGLGLRQGMRMLPAAASPAPPLFLPGPG